MKKKIWKKNQDFFLFIYFWHQICVQGPYLMRIYNPYLVGKKSGSDLSSKFGCPVLSSQETHMPSPVEPYFCKELDGKSHHL